MHDELIRMLRLDTSAREARTFRVTIASAPANSRGQHMPVVRIRQTQTFDQVFVAGDERILRMFVHEHPGSLQLLAHQVRPVAQRSGHLRNREPYSTSASECHQTGHRSDAEFLIICGQFPKCSLPLFIHPALVLHEHFESDAPVRAHAPTLDLAFVRKSFVLVAVQRPPLLRHSGYNPTAPSGG